MIAVEQSNSFAYLPRHCLTIYLQNSGLASFESSVIAGRLYLNMSGVSAKRDGSALMAITNRDRTDVDVEDLSGKRLDPLGLPSEEQALFPFIVMANKAVAHLTMPGNHDANKASCHPAHPPLP